MYADDTVIYSTSAKTLETFLHNIQKEGKKYGLHINESKSEALCINGIDEIKYVSGHNMKNSNEAKYLGCSINNKAYVRKELAEIMSSCYATWKKLENYWKHSTCSQKQKLRVYNAVIETKQQYGG